MMIKQIENRQPRLVAILAGLLILQTPLLIFLGLNLLNMNWTFLTSWQNFWNSFVSAFQIAWETPGKYVKGENLFYDVIAFLILVLNAGFLFVAGLIFPGGKQGAWILALIGQIGTLTCGIGLYFIHRPSQAYWLIAVGVTMVMYLNYRDVRHWFIRTEENKLGISYAED